MEKCNRLVPMSEHGINPPEVLSTPECLREEGHTGEHLVLSVYGTFWSWFPEDCPGCDDPECIYDPTCFVYSKMLVLEAYRWLCWGTDYPPQRQPDNSQ